MVVNLFFFSSVDLGFFWVGHLFFLICWWDFVSFESKKPFKSLPPSEKISKLFLQGILKNCSRQYNDKCFGQTFSTQKLKKTFKFLRDFQLCICETIGVFFFKVVGCVLTYINWGKSITDVMWSLSPKATVFLPFFDLKFQLNSANSVWFSGEVSPKLIFHVLLSKFEKERFA